MERFRRASNTANITLEPIEEHPTTQPPPPTAQTGSNLCHQDFFNDFPGMLYFTDETDLSTDNLKDLSDKKQVTFVVSTHLTLD